MRKYKGIVKFVSNTGRLALVQQFSMSAEKRVQDVIIDKASSGTDKTFSGDLIVDNNAIIEETSIDITLGALPTVISADDSLATSTGLIQVLASTTGAVVHDGDILVDGISYDGESGEFGWIGGANIAKDDPSIVDYNSGEINIAATAPIGVAGTVVKASYTESKIDADPEKVAMLRGDFSNVSVGDIIYYYYATDAESEIVLERASK